MLKAAFIGAGSRARSVHYPAVFRAKDLVSVEAVAELDPRRLTDAADSYGIPRRFSDYRELLAKVDCDVVYAITRPEHMTAIALDVLKAGKHLFIEKPAGSCSAEAEQIAGAAELAGRYVCVGLQRRWTPMLRAVRAKVEERGPVRLILAGMRKNLLEVRWHPDMPNRLYDQDIHMVDYIRYVCGGEPAEVHTVATDHYTGWMNTYNSVIRFSTGAVGVHTCTGHAGARFYSVELYGNGISAFLRPPQRAEVYRDNRPEAEVVVGKPVAGDGSGRIDEGEDDMHRDFLGCIKEGRQPLTSIHEALVSMRLLETIGNLDERGQPLG